MPDIALHSAPELPSVSPWYRNPYILALLTAATICIAAVGLWVGLDYYAALCWDRVSGSKIEAGKRVTYLAFDEAQKENPYALRSKAPLYAMYAVLPFSFIEKESAGDIPYFDQRLRNSLEDNTPLALETKHLALGKKLRTGNYTPQELRWLATLPWNEERLTSVTSTTLLSYADTARMFGDEAMGRSTFEQWKEIDTESESVPFPRYLRYAPKGFFLLYMTQLLEGTENLQQQVKQNTLNPRLWKLPIVPDINVRSKQTMLSRIAVDMYLRCTTATMMANLERLSIACYLWNAEHGSLPANADQLLQQDLVRDNHVEIEGADLAYAVDIKSSQVTLEYRFSPRLCELFAYSDLDYSGLDTPGNRVVTVFDRLPIVLEFANENASP